MNGKLSPSRVDILRMLIIYEPAILAKVKILNGKSNERPKTVEVMENGQVILYYGSGPKWLQKFFNAYGLVSITDIAIELADTMSGTGEARNEEAFYGIMSAVLKEAKDNKIYLIVKLVLAVLNQENTINLCTRVTKKQQQPPTS
mgnify:CR=1 FL=1